MTKVAAKNLPEGGWVLHATVTIDEPVHVGADEVRSVACELRSGTGFIGGTGDRRLSPDGDGVVASLTMNGGAQVPPGGGEVSVWCNRQGGNGRANAQMVISQVSFF